MATVFIFGQKHEVPLTVFSAGHAMIIQLSARQYRHLAFLVNSGEETRLAVGIIKAGSGRQRAEHLSQQSDTTEREYRSFMSMPTCAAGIKCQQQSNVQSHAKIRRKISDSTLAGSGTPGNSNGSGTAASFNDPWGLAVDADGDVYIADADNNEIRKITPAGAVTTLAGYGIPGNANGTGTAASFNHPEGVAVDAEDDVYVADTGNNEIREITSAGVVSTLAGSGSPGKSDGGGAYASFNHPDGIAVDSQGNVYVADTGNDEIREIIAGGAVITLAGSGAPGDANGVGVAASFDHPEGIAVDSTDHVYVADTRNDEIRKITPGNVVSTLAGSGSPGNADGIAAAASFDNPSGVAVDSVGNLFVADGGNDELRVIIKKSGEVATVARSTSSNEPIQGVATGPSKAVDILYLTEGGDDLIDKLIL